MLRESKWLSFRQRPRHSLGRESREARGPMPLTGTSAPERHGGFNSGGTAADETWEQLCCRVRHFALASREDDPGRRGVFNGADGRALVTRSRPCAIFHEGKGHETRGGRTSPHSGHRAKYLAALTRPAMKMGDQ